MPFACNKAPAGIGKRSLRQLASHARWAQTVGWQCASGAYRLIGKARAINYGHGYQPANVAMAVPITELHQIISTHDPDELGMWTCFPQPFQCIIGKVIRTSFFRTQYLNLRVMFGDDARGITSVRQRHHHMLVFERVLRRYQPPDLIKAKRSQSQLAHMQMPIMRRIERAAKKSYFQPCFAVKDGGCG